MRWDRLCFPLLLGSLCLGLVFHWAPWTKALTAVSAAALLVSVLLALRGGKRGG